MKWEKHNKMVKKGLLYSLLLIFCILSVTFFCYSWEGLIIVLVGLMMGFMIGVLFGVLLISRNQLEGAK